LALFLGSPMVERLGTLMSYGLTLFDLPIMDRYPLYIFLYCNTLLQTVL
jgi:hypothetical protein